MIRNSFVTLFEKTRAAAMASSPFLFSAVDERATKSVPGGPTQAHTKWCARTRGFDNLHPIYLSVHAPLSDMAPKNAPLAGWPLNGLSRTTPAFFFQNHYMVNPPRKAQMARGAQVMREIKFARTPDVVDRAAAAAAATAVATLPPDLLNIYDCWRGRLHESRFLRSTTSTNFLFLADASAPCADHAGAPPWRGGRRRLGRPARER